jgi:hypothetical protein
MTITDHILVALVLAVGVAFVVWPCVDVAKGVLRGVWPKAPGKRSPDPWWWRPLLLAFATVLGLGIGQVAGEVFWEGYGAEGGRLVGLAAGPNAHWLHRLGRRWTERRSRKGAVEVDDR